MSTSIKWHNFSKVQPSAFITNKKKKKDRKKEKASNKQYYGYLCTHREIVFKFKRMIVRNVEIITNLFQASKLKEKLKTTEKNRNR